MKVFLYVLDTLSDWEIGYVTAELNSRRFLLKGIDCELVKVGSSREVITTMGGMRITPDMAVEDMSMSEDDIFIMPGAATWLEEEHGGTLRMAKELIVKDRRVAAICGATIGLASVGALNEKKHTSNDLGYLRMVAAEYAGQDGYLDLPAVSDRNLVTASGLSPVEFTYEVLKVLGVMRNETLEAWKSLNLTNEPKYFHELMESLG